MFNLVLLLRHRLYPTPYFCYQEKIFLLPWANCKFKILTPNVLFLRLSTQHVIGSLCSMNWNFIFRTLHKAQYIQSTPGRFVLYRGWVCFWSSERWFLSPFTVNTSTKDGEGMQTEMLNVTILSALTAHASGRVMPEQSFFGTHLWETWPSPGELLTCILR